MLGPFSLQFHDVWLLFGSGVSPPIVQFTKSEFAKRSKMDLAENKLIFKEERNVFLELKYFLMNNAELQQTQTNITIRKEQSLSSPKMQEVIERFQSSNHID